MLFSQAEIRELVAEHFDAEQVDTMTAIIMAESGGESTAINDNYPRWQPDPNSVYRYDYGLAQINSLWGYPEQELLNNPSYNIGAARYVYDQQGFKAWSTYNAGAHLRFMPDEEVVNPVAEEVPAVPQDRVPLVDRPRRPQITSDADVQAWLRPLSNADYLGLIGVEYHGGKKHSVYSVRVILPEDE